MKVRFTLCVRMRAGYYMHPAVADNALHLSAVLQDPAAAASSGHVPVSLSSLAAPQQRNGLLQTPWASAISAPDSGAVLGSMTVTAAARNNAPCLRVSGLRSKIMPAARHAAPQQQVGNACP